MAHVPSRQSRYFEGDKISIAAARRVFLDRPTEYDQDLFDTIITMVACGESLNEICADRDAPLPATFFRWLKEDERLAERYRDAQEIYAEMAFEEATSQAFDNDAVRGGVRHRALLERAARMMPDKYGPRATIRNTKEVEDEAGGIDWSGDVRRRLQAMADRLQQPVTPAGADEGRGPSGEG